MTAMSNPRTGPCGLCERERPLTFHHYIPKRCHKNKWFRKSFTREQMNEGLDVCRDCHAAIHKFIPDHKQLATFVAWIRGRESTGRVRTRTTR